MKNSLVNKVKEGAKQVWNAGKKVILPVAAGTLLYFATTQDGNAQNRDNQKNVYSYENHNKGATIEKDKIRVKDGKDLEVKMLQGRGQYFQNLPLTIKGFPKNTKKISIEDVANTFDDTLGLVSFYRNTAQYDLDAYTKGFLEISSKEPYQWVRAKDGEGNDLNVIPLSLKINPKTGKPEIYAEILCDNQLNKKNGVTDKNASYIAKENLEDILKQLTDNLSTLNLNRKINGQTIKTNFYFPSASDSTVYLIPNIKENTKLRILPATKNNNGIISRIRQVAIVSPLGVYEQVRTNGEVSIGNVPTSSVSGTVVNAYADKNVISSQSKSKKITPDSTKTKRDLALIVSGEGSSEFVGGRFGFRGKRFGLIANYDVLLPTLDKFTTPISPNTGRYGDMSKETTGNVIGGSLEVYFGDNWELCGGVGANYWDITEKSREDIMKDGQVIKPGGSQNSYNKVSGKAYGVLGKSLGKNKKVKVRLGAGYDTEAKFIGEAGLSISLN